MTYSVDLGFFIEPTMSSLCMIITVSFALISVPGYTQVLDKAVQQKEKKKIGGKKKTKKEIRKREREETCLLPPKVPVLKSK